uniref:Uncharacterized protein n=1 Tax=Candidatus Kentrum sp. FW TaxID=2126338 RepID=A0A450TRN1_9GAMM|nr:MAG: hypothetical protein BECKFW1821C_GA0114237_10256 [Candidatus Kentron sp. FW]
MTNRIRKEQIKVLGIDLAKQSFQLHGQDKRCLQKNQWVNISTIP